MTSQLCPYLAFDGNAREAMGFYRSVFGGTLNVTTFGDLGGGPGVPADGIMHAQLVTDRGYVLMASDTPGRMDVQIGTAMTVSIFGDDAEELRRYWAALSADGAVQMPLDKQVWGDEFGMCTDRFGIPWMINITQAAQ